MEDIANHWWVNWGYEDSVCDCPSSPHQDCPSPLLARYIDWQNRVATATSCPSSDPSAHPHPFYFSFPLKGDRGGGGRSRGERSSLRKSRKVNTIPQNALGACSPVCTTTAINTTTTTAASISSSSIGQVERKKPKGILKPQRSFDSTFLPPPRMMGENSSAKPCNLPPQPHRAHTHTHSHSDGLSTSLPAPSMFSHSSSKMPKKGILKNLYGGESGYCSSPERGMSGAGTGVGGRGVDGDMCCSYDPHSRSPSSEHSPTMRTEAVRRRKGILKRNGKFSHSLDLPDALHPSLSSALAHFPEALHQLHQASGGSRPPSVVSEDSLLSSDSFDLLDLSAQSRRRIFSRGTQCSACSSEEELEDPVARAADGIGLGRGRGREEEDEMSLEERQEMLR